MLRDDQGNIITDIAGNASFAREFGYQTEPLLDAAGNPVLDASGNPEVALAVQNFFLDRDFDSFGGNILTTAHWN